MKLDWPKGTKITVYDHRQVELGEGTLLQTVVEREANLTVYECEEHVILAKGEHWVTVNGILYAVGIESV